MKLIAQLSLTSHVSTTTAVLFPAWMFFLSICAHGLVIFCILHTYKSTTRQPQIHAVVVDLVMSKHGASSDDKTQIEPEQKASIAENRSSVPVLETTPYQPVKPAKSKLNITTQNIEPSQSINTLSSEKPAQSATTIKRLTASTAAQTVKEASSNQSEKRLDTKPPTTKLVKNQILNKQIENPTLEQTTKKLSPKKTPDRTIKKQESQQKPKSVRRAGRTKSKRVGSATTGSGRKHKGRTRSGITQGASHIGSGLSNPRPPYPVKARSNGYQGRVLLVVIVNKRGRAKTISLHKSSGYVVLDRAALKTVKKWRFRPALKNGIPVEARVILPIKFRLKG